MLAAHHFLSEVTSPVVGSTSPVVGSTSPLVGSTTPPVGGSTSPVFGSTSTTPSGSTIPTGMSSSDNHLSSSTYLVVSVMGSKEQFWSGRPQVQNNIYDWQVVVNDITRDTFINVVL